MQIKIEQELLGKWGRVGDRKKNEKDITLEPLGIGNFSIRSEFGANQSDRLHSMRPWKLRHGIQFSCQNKWKPSMK
jgi:hypothetical protein